MAHEHQVNSLEGLQVPTHDAWKVLEVLENVKFDLKDEQSDETHTFYNMKQLFNSPLLEDCFCAPSSTNTKGKVYKTLDELLAQNTKLNLHYVTTDEANKGLLTTKSKSMPKPNSKRVPFVKLSDNFIKVIEGAFEHLPSPNVIVFDLFRPNGSSKPLNTSKHVVEVRGKPNQVEEIWFRAEHIGAMLEIPDFVSTVLNPVSAYKYKTDYDVFNVSNDTTSSTSPSKKDKKLFLTFIGVMHAIHTSKSKEFVDHFYKQTYIFVYGTEAAIKNELVKTTYRVDKTFLTTFLSLAATDIACLYLINTCKSRDNKSIGIPENRNSKVTACTIFKYGQTNNLVRRQSQHTKTFGEDCVLDTMAFIPLDKLEEAESDLRDMIHDLLLNPKTKDERIVVSNNEARERVRKCMQVISEKYMGRFAVQAQDMQVLKLKHEIEIRKLKSKLRDVETRLETDLLKKENEELKRKVAQLKKERSTTE